MSYKLHPTDEAFAALRSLCANSYRMYDPEEFRSYYDHDCATYECAVEDAAREYERLLKHCEKQREELAAIKNPLGRLKEEFMDNIDGGTEIEHIEGSSKVRAGSSITDELREFIDGPLYLGATALGGWKEAAYSIADRIDERHERAIADAELAASPTEAQMAELGYVKLPVDEDGKTILIGNEYACDGRTVKAMWLEYLGHDDWAVHVSEGIEDYCEPFELHEIQPDSWERIIADAVAEGFERTDVSAPYEVGNEALVERCRRLADGD